MREGHYNGLCAFKGSEVTALCLLPCVRATIMAFARLRVNRQLTSDKNFVGVQQYKSE